MRTPEAFLFDIGNVLVTFDYHRFLGTVESRSPLSPEAVGKAVEDARAAYESGATGTDLFIEQLLRTTQFGGTRDELASAWMEIFAENPLMETLVSSLASNYPLYLLSNTNPLHLQHLTETFSVFRHFLGGVYSFAARSEKPDPGIYQSAIDRFNLNPDRTVYIDDRPENIEAGERFGLRALSYNHLRHQDFLRLLARTGITLPTA